MLGFKQRKEIVINMANVNDVAGNLVNQNDKFHVMMNQELATLQEYYKNIAQIDASLNKVYADLANQPGVEAALAGIESSRQENYNRLAQYQNAERAAQDLFTAIQGKYAEFQEALGQLPQLTTAPAQQRLGSGNPQQATSTQPNNAQGVNTNVQ